MVQQPSQTITHRCAHTAVPLPRSLSFVFEFAACSLWRALSVCLSGRDASFVRQASVPRQQAAAREDAARPDRCGPRLRDSSYCRSNLTIVSCICILALAVNIHLKEDLIKELGKSEAEARNLQTVLPRQSLCLLCTAVWYCAARGVRE